MMSRLPRAGSSRHRACGGGFALAFDEGAKDVDAVAGSRSSGGADRDLYITHWWRVSKRLGRWTCTFDTDIYCDHVIVVMDGSSFWSWSLTRCVPVDDGVTSFSVIAEFRGWQRYGMHQ